MLAQAAPAAATTPQLGELDFSEPSARFDLPGRLDEVSGLAFSPDGRLFAHDDERGRVYEIDPATGRVGKRWDAGEDVVRADFEGIAIAGARFFLVTSRGLLYELREAADGESAPFRVTDTGVGATCEVEGLDYDPAADALLIACKVSTDRAVILVHRLPLDPAAPRLEPLRVPRTGLAPVGLDEDFEPSAVAVGPTGTLWLVSGPRRALIEVAPDGRILRGVDLPRRRHRQPEGLGFAPDGTLYVADEASGGRPRLTAYGRVGAGRGGAR